MGSERITLYPEVAPKLRYFRIAHDAGITLNVEMLKNALDT